MTLYLAFSGKVSLVALAELQAFWPRQQQASLEIALGPSMQIDDVANPLFGWPGSLSITNSRTAIEVPCLR